MTWREKLHPKRFPNMSVKMMLILGYILEEDFVAPALKDLWVTESGDLDAMHYGEHIFNHMAGCFGGSEEDLQKNWANLLSLAGLTDEEKIEAQKIYDSRIQKRGVA